MGSSAFDTFLKITTGDGGEGLAKSLLDRCKYLFPNAYFCMKERTTLFRCAQKVSMDKTFGWCHPEETLNEFTEAENLIQKIGHHFPVCFSLFTLTESDSEFALNLLLTPRCWSGRNFIASPQALVTSPSPQS